MRMIAYSRPRTVEEAVGLLVESGGDALPFFGGTTLLDLTKLEVLTPRRLVDLRELRADFRAIWRDSDGTITIGGLATMAEVARNPLLRAEAPAIVAAVREAASPQVRNMASIAGNVLQRTRCPYYRDISWTRCNRRVPGSGCQAIAGVATSHAVLGGSAACVASYPGDLAPVLAALEASAVLMGRGGRRSVPVDGLHRPPGVTPECETVLAPGDLILAFRVPRCACLRRSAFVKLRNRAAYEFAEASAMVALDIEDGVIRDARVGLGAVATVPWRSRAAEATLVGMRPEDAAVAAANAAFSEAVTRPDTAYKVEMGKRAVIAAIHQAAAFESEHG
ncbi:MAG: xanthine dehydrogenase family protein subunit M [Pseudomonadota bacterium]|jgi:xanthine dehydrogenase YagS FAD-binding subunit|nr:xanthine dehydrogenase family protein subunit M [Pseudomonadota bacterium]